MPKKEQLEKIIRGKGLEALRPQPENAVSEPAADWKLNTQNFSSEDQEITPLTVEVNEENSKNQKQLNENCVIKEIILTDEKKKQIHEILGADSHQILIRDAFISQNGKRGSLFKNYTMLTFNVCCTASGLIAQLKPEFEVHWISYDLLRMQIQPFYKFSVISKPFWNNFVIQFQINPAAVGFFNFHIILEIKAAELFWVKEGFVFKIENSTA